MDIAHLIAHPEELNKDTLYDLRRLVAVHPTYHAARILFLKNLFLLHDSTFDQELRRAALLVPDRSVLFAITQGTEANNIPQEDTNNEADKATHETLSPVENESQSTLHSEGAQTRGGQKKYQSEDSTSQFLNNVLSGAQTQTPKRQIKVDPSIDYMGYLLQSEEEKASQNGVAKVIDPSTRMDMLIDDFIERHTERIVLSENPMVPEGIIDEPEDYTAPTIPQEEPVTSAAPIVEEHAVEENVINEANIEDNAEEQISEDIAEEQISEDIVEEDVIEEEIPEDIVEEVVLEDVIEEDIIKEGVTDEGIEDNTTEKDVTDEDTSNASFSETLARAYIKQQKYDRAIEVMNKLHAASEQNNPYFADQVRFLQKLAIANKHRKQ